MSIGTMKRFFDAEYPILRPPAFTRSRASVSAGEPSDAGADFGASGGAAGSALGAAEALAAGSAPGSGACAGVEGPQATSDASSAHARRRSVRIMDARYANADRAGSLLARMRRDDPARR